MASRHNKHTEEESNVHDSSELLHIDNVPSNVRFSRSIAMVYVFEDNEAVIHVSRTHRVSHDWLFHRINLDPEI